MAPAKNKKTGRKRSLDDRFEFVGDAVAPANREKLKAALFEVEDRDDGDAERTLKLWRKTGTPLDDDLRALWLHEMRQVQRLMAYSGAREVIVDVLELVEDDADFGVVLERVGRPLSEMRRTGSRQHWLKNLAAPRQRTLLWQNIRRLAEALGIVHAQGLVHGRVGADAVMTEGAQVPDFQLGGFEWSLWLQAPPAKETHASLGPETAAKRARAYSFAEDWQALGRMVASLLGVEVREGGDVVPTPSAGFTASLSPSERDLLRRLVAPSRRDALDADVIRRRIDDTIAGAARATSTVAGTFILLFDERAGLGDAVYAATEGEIASDDLAAHLEWVGADLDGDKALLVPRAFEPGTSRMTLVTSRMTYRLAAFYEAGSPLWDIAVCRKATLRGDAVFVRDYEEHSIVQSIEVVARKAAAQELRSRLGANVLDWSAFAAVSDGATLDANGSVRSSLLLIQVVEAVLKALESYPVEIVNTDSRPGRRYAVLRARPDEVRDGLATEVRGHGTAEALRRLFEEDQREGEDKWTITRSSGLGASRHDDVAATFVDMKEFEGGEAYEFELDGDPPQGRLFLRAPGDAGTERVVRRRFRNIAALKTRVDLLEMLDDPLRARRSSRDQLDEGGPEFQDLDPPKQDALRQLWEMLPGFFVVGPPGVGKTYLATEIIRRRFADRASRILLTAQGHDALNKLQADVTKMIRKSGMDDVIMVRTTTNDRTTTTDEEVHRVAAAYLAQLSGSPNVRGALKPIRERVLALEAAARMWETQKKTLSKEDGAGVNAFLNLLLDAANIVISTANSPDIERMVEAREQFDWVIVEEAAKATGPELVGPLMLSGRRLLIGDHHQLPPFDEERLLKILTDQELVKTALSVADQVLEPLGDTGVEELVEMCADSATRKRLSDIAVRMLQPFKTFANDDERRCAADPAHVGVVATLTEQGRMDPAIAEIVSVAFYGGSGRLKTANKRLLRMKEPPPFASLDPLPPSPVVVVDCEHVSSTGRREPLERGRRRWHNPSEIEVVLDVLRHVRAPHDPGPEGKPSIAVLTPYRSQADRLQQRIANALKDDLSHLTGFSPARSDGEIVSTVDAFQGNDADLVVVSLVRNNPRAGKRALGFLSDSRRMNVLLSRAKFKLVLVGSLRFVKEAVRGVNPNGGKHELSFLTDVIDTINKLTKEKRSLSTDGTSHEISLATIIPPRSLSHRA
ncbi:MAG TPA: AAA domain-containing protein [Stellaceae bacterium]|nr:AAA domain-containing protein [Stellaceae bacterium]